MNKLKIELEHCFGIKRLVHEFSFEANHTQLVYAANGMMKSSLARTLRCLSGQLKEPIRDRIHPDLVSVPNVWVDGAIIQPEHIFVADPEDRNFDTSGVFTNFLVDSTLKAQYDTIYQQLNDYVTKVITPLKEVSISSDCADELLRTFTEASNDNLFSVFERLAPELQDRDYRNFGFRYNHVFDRSGKVKRFVERHATDLNNYIKEYNQLVASSPVFRTVDGITFGTHQAAELTKSVEGGEFFGVDHKIKLHGGREINSPEELIRVFEEEKERIANSAELKKSFDRITKDVDGNSEVRVFKEILVANPDLTLELGDYEDFRRRTWMGYLSAPEVKPHVLAFNAYYQTQKALLNHILDQARAQLPQWQEIIALYNDRFHVPFRVEIVNQEDIILKQAAAKLKFTYLDSIGGGVVKQKEEMIEILSRGEQRAFYILQLLFELESRKASGEDQLVVFDDIADSFDYQNKYAIIEYLHDLNETSGNIYMLVLTHNFDFYRTIGSRLRLGSNSWMTIKKVDGTLELKPGQYQHDLFSHFIQNHRDDKVFVSMIPFVRNLIEYTEGETADYTTLTSCLHLKSDTMAIMDNEVIRIVKKFIKGQTYARVANNVPVYGLIIATADGIVAEASIDEVKIENKIVLAMACRLKAEVFLKQRLLNAGLTDADLVTDSNQTAEWTKLYKLHCAGDSSRSVIEQVNMMTPEFIHINSFMYEPLIDLSVEHLVALYKKICLL